MWRYIGSHAHSDSCGAVHQKVGVPAGQHCGLFLRIVEVWVEIHCVLVDVRQKLHGNLRKPGLRVTHGGSAVPVHGAKIPVSVHQRIPGGPFLGHVHQRAIDGTVPMGMVFTHGITYDTGALTVGLIGTVVQFDHGIEHAALNRFESVPYVRQRPGSDDAHGIVNKERLHSLFQIHLMNLIYFRNIIKNIVLHVSSPCNGY